MAVLAVDRFALRHMIGAAVDREIHVARCEEVHFDARMDIVPHRAMAEILDRDITAEFAVDAFEEIEVERRGRSEEHTSELQSLMRISYAVFCLKKKKREKERIIIHSKTE